jgi:hypothetical protein
MSNIKSELERIDNFVEDLLEIQEEQRKCTHLLPKTPKQIWAKKSSLETLCDFVEKTHDDFAYIFVPYEDEFKNFSYAYTEIDLRYLNYLLEEAKENTVELVSNFKILHLEPGRHISQARRKEISDFFKACREYINYPQMAVA